MIGYALAIAISLFICGAILLLLIDDGYAKISIALFIFAAACAYLLFTNPICIKERQIADLEREKADNACRTPKLNTSIDGISVYVYRDGCNGELVYFSKSMTKTKRCHAERVGKISHQVCNDFIVTNAE